jgi:hypothetical protein
VRHVKRLLVGSSVVAVSLASTLVTAPAALAAPNGFSNGGDQGHGYQAIARYVRLTGDTGGDGTPSFAGGEPPFVPCVWRDGMSNAEMADWAKGNVRDGRIATEGVEYMGVYDGHRSPTAEEFEARRDDASGAWYIKDCVVPPELQDVETGSSYAIQQLYLQFVDPDTAAIVWSTTGTPAPPVVPQMLVWFAERALLLLAPDMRHSPAGDGVVHLPTWFWSVDRDDRLVRASVGPVWAEVEATPESISVRASGPAPGAVDCPDLGRDGTAAGQAASSCSITFARAGQYGLAATTSYTALWRGSDGSGGGLADKVGPTWTPPAPFMVNEVQVEVGPGRPGG